MIRRPPEVLQASGMDCGPAALAALLGAHGLDADAGALRTACATDVDGTSIDDLADVAHRLGLDAEQVVVPLSQVLAAPERYLPALLLVRTPDGLAHTVCLWRVRRGRVDLVDPAVGRRRVRVADLADEVFVHELDAPLDAWAAYAGSEDAVAALETRLETAGLSVGVARERVRGALQCGPVDGIGALLSELDGEPVVELLPGGDTVRVRGAVLVRAVTARVGHELPEELADVLGAPPPPPLRTLWTHAARFPGRLAAAVAGVLGTAAGTVAEAVLARDLLRNPTAAGLLTLAAVVAGTMVCGTALGALVANLGRQVERDVLTALLARLPRLGDAYASTRPAGDLAERAHALRLVREGTELAALGIQRGVETAVLAGAVVALAPAAWPAAVVLVALAATVPVATMRLLRESDLRNRAVGGALAQLAVDLLGGLAAVRAHRGGPVVLAWQADLLRRWTSSARRLGRARAGASLLASGPALLLAAATAGLASGGGSDVATVLAVSALAFLAAGATGDLAASSDRLTSLRSVLARVLDPLHAPVVDPEPLGYRPAPDGSAISLRGVDVRCAGTTVLHDVDLEIAPGEHVAVVGPSGAGKSTLLAVLGGWLPVARGAFLVDGAEPVGLRLAELRAALAWSDPQARLRDVTAPENVPAEDPLVVLTAVGFAGDLDVGVGEAGGRLDAADAQRLRLARALARPCARLVLLDEALRGLPSAERARLLAHARRVWARATLVHVTHDPAEATGFDRVVVVAGGTVIETGNPDELTGRPDGEFARLYAMHTGLAARLGRPARTRARASIATPMPAVSREPATRPRRGHPAGPWRIRSGEATPPDAAERTGSMAIEVRSGTVPGGGWSRPPRAAWRPDLRSVALPVLALAAAAGSIAVMVAASEALHDGLVTGASWLPVVLALLAAAVTASAVGHITDAELGVRVGRGLRRGVVTGLLADDPRRHGGDGTGARLGRLLDLETVERAVRDTGAALAVGAAQVVAAAVVAGQGALAVVLLAGLAACVLLAVVQAWRATTVALVRRQVSAVVVDRMLGYRTGTVYPPPQDAGLPDALLDAERAEDRWRTAATAALPRTVAAAGLLVLAAAPPTDVVAALGAVLLALVGLETLARASTDLAPARAAWLGSRDLFGRSTSQPALPADIGEPSRDVLFHQPVFGNALLGSGHWPPTDADFVRLEARLADLGLDDVVARMPGGVGQTLGATGWRLSEGERARFALLRAQLGDPSAVRVEHVLDSLDPATAHRVLNADPQFAR